MPIEMSKAMAAERKAAIASHIRGRADGIYRVAHEYELTRPVRLVRVKQNVPTMAFRVRRGWGVIP